MIDETWNVERLAWNFTKWSGSVVAYAQKETIEQGASFWADELKEKFEIFYKARKQALNLQLYSSSSVNCSFIGYSNKI